jgi:Cys-tRNA synthase (O-phospho-L-seryl-tRNA:Cys-tRNA synthase)
MATFDTSEIKSKAKRNFAEQVFKAQWFSAELENLSFIQLGKKPHKHDLLHFDAPALYEISKRIREKGIFLHKEVKERGIWVHSRV